MYREPKLPHVLCGLSFCEACHFVRPIPVVVKNSYLLLSRGVIALLTKQSHCHVGLSHCHVGLSHCIVKTILLLERESKRTGMI